MMFEQFQKYARENQLFGNRSRILLAVSGGIDSMVMAHLFQRMGIDTGIAHCNFSLRGDESDLDEELVRKFAEDNRLSFYCERFNTKEFSAANKISVQMAARQLRYEWFHRLRIENNYDAIAVAHNLNDNIETLLINLTRGTGLTGLTGIKPAAEYIIRPLLFATREEIAAYCSENKIFFREDRSNAETKYTRNKIRHLVIPLLREINPSIEKTLNNTAKRLASLDKIIERQIDELKNQISIESGELTIFDVKKLTDLKADKSLIFELFVRYGINDSTSSDLLRLLKGKTGSVIYTGTHRIIRNRNEIIVSPYSEEVNTYHYITCLEDFLSVPGIVSARIIDIKPGFIIPDEKEYGCFDIGKAGFPFKIRRWEKGDFFYPLGLNHRKKLSDFFTDRKYSLPDKEEARILESDGKIIWIIGERLDDRFKVSPDTSRVILIHVLPCRSS